MTNESGNLNCPECGHPCDPMYNHCIKCGYKLDGITRVDSDIEPDPEAPLDEPRYEGGTGASVEEKTSKKSADLPKYTGIDDSEPESEAIVKKSVETRQASGCFIGLIIILTILFPPIGIAMAIVWAFNQPYRKAVLPVFAATIVGILFWGYLLWGNMRSGMYDFPYEVMNTYITAQAEANVHGGHYMSLMELKRQGYLKSEFPVDDGTEVEIVEHVLGPTGFIVEIKPGDEEAKFFRIESLWSDQTGEIHLGSIDGPRYVPN